METVEHWRNWPIEDQVRYVQTIEEWLGPDFDYEANVRTFTESEVKAILA